MKIPQEDICQVEVGELGKIVELGRESAKQVEKETRNRSPPPPGHFDLNIRFPD